MKYYGNLINRIEEGKNYTNREIQVGDDITMYYWSDRKCYYITKVADQKNIFVKPYEVCADHSKVGGMGHQNWLYFKTAKEMQQYINDCIDKGLIKNSHKYDLSEVRENAEQEWCFRYGHWNYVKRYNMNSWNRCLITASKDVKNPTENIEAVINLARHYFGLNDDEFAQMMLGKEIVKYERIQQNISFGVRDYYYDWEF